VRYHTSFLALQLCVWASVMKKSETHSTRAISRAENRVQMELVKLCKLKIESLATTQRHIITSPETYRHWWRTFLGTSHGVFYVQWNIFNKEMAHVSAWLLGGLINVKFGRVK